MVSGKYSLTVGDKEIEIGHFDPIDNTFVCYYFEDADNFLMFAKNAICQIKDRNGTLVGLTEFLSDMKNNNVHFGKKHHITGFYYDVIINEDNTGMFIVHSCSLHVNFNITSIDNSHDIIIKSKTVDTSVQFKSIEHNGRTYYHPSSDCYAKIFNIIMSEIIFEYVAAHSDKCIQPDKIDDWDSNVITLTTEQVLLLGYQFKF